MNIELKIEERNGDKLVNKDKRKKIKDICMLKYKVLWKLVLEKF